MSSSLKSIWAPSPSTERGTSIKISSHKDGDRFAFTNGRGVFLRSLSDPGKTIAYFEHPKPVTVAKISPSGFYVASGDVSGNVRVWDIAGTDQVLKIEVKALGGAIKDIAWDGESKRIIAVGHGNEKYGHAFAVDTGSSIGQITGHSKTINAVAMKPSRPFRAVTSSDDGTLVFYHGVPYKFNCSIKSHQPSSFIHTVAYAPDGSVFASAGSDKAIFIYDGASGESQGSLNDNSSNTAHSGGVYSLEFSSDSKQLISCSSDGTVKLWDVASKTLKSTWSLAKDPSKPTPEEHQVGLSWLSSSKILAVSLSGKITVIDPNAGPSTEIYGHQKGITAMSISDSNIISGSYDGVINKFTANGEAQPISGAGPTNQVNTIICNKNDNKKASVISMDDTLRQIDLSKNEFTSLATSTASLPKSLCTLNDTFFLFSAESKIQAFRNGGQEQVLDQSLSFTPTAIAINQTTPNEKVLAIGAEDGNTFLYNVEVSASNKITLNQKTLEAPLNRNRGQVTVLKFNPTQPHLLAAGDSAGKIYVYDLQTCQVQIQQWVHHTSRITSIDWTSDGKHAASTSLDSNVYVWSLNKPLRKIAIMNIHPGGGNCVEWLNDTTLVSAGSDCTIRTFEITHHSE